MGSMQGDVAALLPEALLAAGAVAGLLLGSFLPRHRQWIVGLFAIAVCLTGILATVAAWGQPPATVFDGSYAIDVASNATRVIVLVSVVLVILISGEFFGHHRQSEYYVLVLLAGLGTVVLAGSSDLLLLVAGYLLASIPLYALAGFGKDDGGTEAALKYYLLGALLGVVMLAGVTLLFGIGGSSRYSALSVVLAGAPRPVVAVGVVAVLAGLLFKIGGVPAHFWVPDVAQGSRAPVAAFVTTVPKVGALVATFRLLATALGPIGAEQAALDWPLLLAILAAVSMTLGNLAAFFQNNVRRLLAYSTISQVGYLLMAVAVATASSQALPSLLVYLGAYAVTNLGAFAVVCAIPRHAEVGDFRGMIAARPALAVGLVVCLLGLVGTPPTGVFVGKLTVFTAAWDGGLAWLVIVAAVNTVASLFYYLRWIVPVVTPAPAAQGEWLPARAPATVAIVTAAVSVAYGLASGGLLAVFSGGLVVG